MTQPQDLVTEIEALGGKLAEAKGSITRRFIGQERVVNLVLSAILCGGHGLLIGLPGLGKTRLVDTLSTVLGLEGARVQFTPDLMPADILGSEVLDAAADGTRSFRFLEGPVFCQLLLADEINRASADHGPGWLIFLMDPRLTSGCDRSGHSLSLFFVVVQKNDGYGYCRYRTFYDAVKTKETMKMVKRLSFGICLGLLSLCSAVYAGSELNMQDGMWEITSQVKMQGMTIPPMTFSQCITKDNAVPGPTRPDRTTARSPT